MPDPSSQSDRTAEQRQADHAGLARLSETLVPALVAKLNASGLGELEVREGDWRIRLRRPAMVATAHRKAERARPALAADRRDGAPAASAHPAGDGRTAAPKAPATPDRAAATSPAVGIFRPVAVVGTRVRQGDRIAVVDLLGIPQDVVSPIDGVLVDVFAEVGEAVEYGEEVAAVEGPMAHPAPADGASRDAEG